MKIIKFQEDQIDTLIYVGIIDVVHLQLRVIY